MPLPFRSVSGALAVTALWIACLPPTTEPEGLVDYEPLPEYAMWYVELQRCAHVTGTPITDVRWRQLPGATRIVYADTTLAAYWLPPAEIVISGAYIRSEKIVKHELLHHMLRTDSRHRDPSWVECGLIDSGEK